MCKNTFRYQPMFHNTQFVTGFASIAYLNFVIKSIDSWHMDKKNVDRLHLVSLNYFARRIYIQMSAILVYLYWF